MLNACRNIHASSLLSFIDKSKSTSHLKQIHASVIILGLYQNHFLVSRIIFSWNTIIRGYSHSKNPNKSISSFVHLLRSGLFPDHLTYPFVIKASARLLNEELGGSIHSHVLRNGYGLDRFVLNSLIHMYGAFGDAVDARKVFDEIPVRNLVSWNSMVDGYAKCGDMGSARKLFDSMSERDVVSWSLLIDGFVKSGEYEDALAVFERMRVLGPKANDVTMVSVLCACSHLGALDKGKLMHRYIVDKGLKMTLTLRTSLVDMYAKCGALDEALAVFRGVSKEKSDVLIWNAMIGGLATHGFFKEAFDLFEEMRLAGLKSDDITYLCLLNACAHGRLVGEAWRLFECLEEPKSEHYACMVDALARAGQVEEAYRFLCRMPVEPTASTLGALLSGCINHRKLDLAELVGKKLIELDPDHDGRYIGLSNAYALVRRWDEVRNMREAMEGRGVKKSPGYSCFEISGAFHRFVAHDKLHPIADRVYVMLSLVVSQMKVDTFYENQEHYLYHAL